MRPTDSAMRWRRYRRGAVVPAPSCGAMSRAPSGGAAPQSRIRYGGEDCLSEASSAALTFGTGAKEPRGPRTGANGFGSFCRNKRTSSRGAETPQELFLPSVIPDLIRDPGFFLFPSFVKRTTLDSCFRRNDSRGAGMTASGCCWEFRINDRRERRD